MPKICYKSTFLHCSNILIRIPCNNVQFFTLMHAHKPQFFVFAETVPNFLLLLFLLFFFLLSYPRSFLLFTSFFLAEKVWAKSSVNPEKGALACSCTDFAPKTQHVFFSISSVRMQSIYKMHSPMERSIHAVSVA